MTSRFLDREGDAAFRLMFERSADAILLLDTETNRFVEYNQATLDMLGCSREELSALHPSELSPPTQPDGRDSYEKANEMIATAIREGSHRFEWTHCSPHRDEFPVEVLLTPLVLGPLPLLVVVWRDITERKRSERALQQAQKLESVGVLAGGIAHDFNNLLTAMLGHLHLARSVVEPGHPAASHLDTLEQGILRAADLTRQLLAYGGRAAFQVESVELGRLAREMADLFSVAVSKRVALTWEIGDAPAVRADRAQAQQVIMNLLTNASEAIADADGRVTLRVGAVEVDAATLERDFPGQGLEPGTMVVLEVEDTGRGMGPDQIERIFDPFYSTKQPGRGLGLSALRGILKAHGAGVAVRSRVAQGTTFRTLWPARDTPAPVPAPRASAAARTEGSRGSGTVLLVDDEDLVRKAVRLLLESLGFAVLEAADGDAAIECYRRERSRISWVLMDLTMPHRDGHAAFLELRRIDPDVLVVLSSGWAEDEVAARFAAAPPSGFLQKPFTITELEDRLGRLGLL